MVGARRTCLLPDPPLTAARLEPHGSHRTSATPGKLPSPNDRTRRAPSHRRMARPFRHGLMGLVDPSRTLRPDPGTTWDFHRSVSSAIVNRRDHLTPRGPEGRTVTFSSEAAPCGTAWCFSTTGSLARRTRPNCDPSRSILAWPLRHRPLLDDAGCVPLRREFEQGFLDGHGPAQVGLSPPFKKG